MAKSKIKREDVEAPLLTLTNGTLAIVGGNSVTLPPSQGGASAVLISEQEYQDIVEKDENTLYVTPESNDVQAGGLTNLTREEKPEIAGRALTDLDFAFGNRVITTNTTEDLIYSLGNVGANGSICSFHSLSTGKIIVSIQEGVSGQGAISIDNTSPFSMIKYQSGWKPIGNYNVYSMMSSSTTSNSPVISSITSNNNIVTVTGVGVADSSVNVVFPDNSSISSLVNSNNIFTITSALAQ